MALKISCSVILLCLVNMASSLRCFASRHLITEDNWCGSDVRVRDCQKPEKEPFCYVKFHNASGNNYPSSWNFGCPDVADRHDMLVPFGLDACTYKDMTVEYEPGRWFCCCHTPLCNNGKFFRKCGPSAAPGRDPCVPNPCCFDGNSVCIRTRESYTCVCPHGDAADGKSCAAGPSPTGGPSTTRSSGTVEEKLNRLQQKVVALHRETRKMSSDLITLARYTFRSVYNLTRSFRSRSRELDAEIRNVTREARGAGHTNRERIMNVLRGVLRGVMNKVVNNLERQVWSRFGRPRTTPGSWRPWRPRTTPDGPNDCPPGRFFCVNNVRRRRRCIPRRWVCDRDNDCGDNSDEQNCTRSTRAPYYTRGPYTRHPHPHGRYTTVGPNNCNQTQFPCVNNIRSNRGRRCIPRSYICDGDNDCGDYSDEQNCNRSTRAPYYTRGPYTRHSHPHGRYTTAPTSEREYLFVTTSLTWRAAERHCNRWKGHLVTITSYENQQYFKREIRARGLAGTWIGYSDENREGSFQWADPADVGNNYTNWATGQPRNGTVIRHCAVIQYDPGLWEWSNTRCTMRNDFICQRRNGEVCRPIMGKYLIGVPRIRTLRNIRSWRDCLKKCQSYSQCKSWTSYHDYHSGICILYYGSFGSRNLRRSSSNGITGSRSCGPEIGTTRPPWRPRTTRSPVQCENGTYRTYQDLNRSVKCENCPKGYYCISNTGSLNMCPAHHYCPEKSSLPIPCPPGTYSNRTGLESKDDCVGNYSSCPFNRFRCDNGRCIRPSLRCNGYIDCHDYSDERHCTRPTTPQPYVPDREFLFSRLSRTFWDAEKYCVQWGGHLATVMSKEENNYFIKNMHDRLMAMTWIGLTDQQKEGSFKWVDPADSNKNFTNWATGAPSGGRKWNCVCLHLDPGEHRWRDFECAPATANFICQRNSSNIVV